MFLLRRFAIKREKKNFLEVLLLRERKKGGSSKGRTGIKRECF